MAKSVLTPIHNAFLATLLKSPWHKFASDFYLLLSFTGQKTGRRYTIPVAYVRKEQLLCVFTRDDWWRNLRSHPAVTVLVTGHHLPGEARLVTDPFLQRATLCDLVALHGEKRVRQLGFWVDRLDGPALEVARAAQGITFIHLCIDGQF